MKLSDLNKTLEGQKELKTILSRLLIYAKSLTRHSQQAEDLTHKTLVKALERESTFDGKNLTAWLRTILLNSFKDELRKKRPDNFTDMNVDETKIGSPNNNESEIILTELEKCLENFSERDREIFRLIGLEYSYEEISEDMNISESNLRQIMYRRRPELAECLEREAA